jgi:hypothetical protein
MAIATVAYVYPVVGAAPPTALQAKCEVVADIVFAAGTADPTPIVHNFGLPAPADGTDGTPVISFVLTAVGGGAAFTVGPKFTFTDANTITVTAINAVVGAPSAFTARVTIRRPHSIIR